MKDKTHLSVLDLRGKVLWHGPIPGAIARKRRIRELEAALKCCSEKLERFADKVPKDSLEYKSGMAIVKYAQGVLSKGTIK
jgi:hypothetical protein